MSPRSLVFLAALSVLAMDLAGAASAAEQLPASKAATQTRARLRGEIVTVEGDQITVHTREGDSVPVTIMNTPHLITDIEGVKTADPASVKVGTYVGVVSQPMPDTTFRAITVILMPPSMRSTPGHSPWDLRTDAMLTLGPISEVAETVGQRTLTIPYKGKTGAQEAAIIFVPAEAPIVTFVPSDASKLIPGAQVIVEATQLKDRTWRADDVIVGVEIVPPM